MDSATTSASTPTRGDTAGVTPSRSSSPSSQTQAKKKTPAAEPKLTDYGVTVKGRFDPDLRRFFVTILDTSSQTLIVQFPSQAAARYAQQLTKAAADSESAPKSTEKKASQEPRLDQTT
jgi:uncharacterized FlaG/YvyC family protein